jgi:hypothetical protein
MVGTQSPQPSSSAISRTCMNWTPDGELAKDDLQQVLARLAAVDAYGSELSRCKQHHREDDSC